MNGTNFTEIAARYEHDSLIQKSAAEKLISLLDIGRDDDILDLGCGTGNLTRKMRAMTNGQVVGTDASPGMVREAEAGKQGLDILYRVASAEDLDFAERFTVAFCNSTFQWFRDPDRALAKCYDALVRGGRMGIQAPAKEAYCPNFLAAIDAVARDPRTAKTFAGFKPPWFFRESAEGYAALFKHAGFAVPFATIETIITQHSPDEVMTIFESGAAAGYLNPNCYASVVDDAYAAAFREIVRESFHGQAGGNGMVDLTFNRIYLVAVKE